MTVITIPFDYNEITHPETIPICIADTDPKGNPVHRVWIEQGVVPVVDRLLHTTQRLLSDKYRASEITEYAVHSLSRTHGDNIGDYPTIKVLNRARLYAVDQRAGGRRARRKLDLDLFVETLDALEDQFDLAAFCESKVTLDKIVEQLEPLGLDRVKEFLPSMLANTDGSELTSLFSQKRIRSLRAFIEECEKRPTRRELVGTEFGQFGV